MTVYVTCGYGQDQHSARPVADAAGAQWPQLAELRLHDRAQPKSQAAHAAHMHRDPPCPLIRPIAAFVTSRYRIHPESDGGHPYPGPRRRCRLVSPR